MVYNFLKSPLNQMKCFSARDTTCHSYQITASKQQQSNDSINSPWTNSGPTLHFLLFEKSLFTHLYITIWKKRLNHTFLFMLTDFKYMTPNVVCGWFSAISSSMGKTSVPANLA